ncbi:glycosyltransferase family A protein [Salinarimonas sp.]|uniref:glycosyltransferase family 2 protein n=1 Tax=Salinarimonas sp. TaxID=2766526 RepID=UPI0032D91649
MRVSVVIPVRDGEAYLAQAVRSVLNQTAPASEVIVVDNGSRDRSAEIATRFGPSVRLLREARPGAAAARATGAAEAVGDALLFLDADDLVGPTALDALCAALVTRGDGVACCPWRRYELVGTRWSEAPASCVPRAPGGDPVAAWLTGWYFPPCAVLWSRAAYARSGGWDPRIGVNDDGHLMMRALLRGVPLVETPDGLAFYRRPPHGVQTLSGRRLTPEGLMSSLAVLESIERLVVEAGPSAEREAALGGAYRRLAAECPPGHEALRARAEDGASRRPAGARGGLPSRRRRLLRALQDLADTSRRAPSARATPRPPVADRTALACAEPVVSVIVPTYNRARTLARALDGALAQTYRHLEVIVVDDASTDATEALVRSRTDTRLRYLRQPANAGVAAARNRGVREARGSLLAFLDSDDAWMPRKLERQVALSRRRPDRVGLFYTGLAVEEANGVSTTWTPRARGDVWRDMLHTNVVHFGTSSTLVRREALEAVGLFDESLPANEDYDLWLRIARFYEFDFVPDPLTAYRNAGGDGGPDERRSRNFDANMRARQTHLDRWGAEMRAAGVKHLFHLDCARRHLESPYGSGWAARLHLLKAVRAAPREPRLALWLAFSMLPAGLRRRALFPLARARRILPDRLWLGRRGGADVA